MSMKLSAMLLGLALMCGTAFAHHGTAAYQDNKQVVVMGTVTEFVFSNPHALVYLDVKQSNGTIAKWEGELTSPNHLVRAGWTKNSLQHGEQITISGLPSKAGSNSMWVRKVVKADGTELPMAFE